MPCWRVVLEGRNFWLELDGEPKRLGFVTTRFVDAPDSGSAELSAVQMIREDPKFGHLLNERSDSPTICVEEVTEVSSGETNRPNAGYTFYEEDLDA